MSAVWNGSTTITISGTGNTLASVCSDIGDITVMQDMGGGIYEVYPLKARYFNIANGGTLTIGDVDDFSVSETLRFPFYANAYGRIYVYSGGRLEIYGDCQVIMNYSCTSAQYPDYSYFYGNIHIEGDATYKPIFRGARRLYIQPMSTTEALWLAQELTLKYCKIGECHRNYVYLNLYYGTPPTFEIDHLVLLNDLYTAVLYCLVGTVDPSLQIDWPAITNISVEDTNAAVTLYYTYPYIKDSTISVTRAAYWYNAQKGMPGVNSGYLTYDFIRDSRNVELFRKVGQGINTLLENVTYNSVYSYTFYTYNGGVLLLKGCTGNKRCLTYTGGTTLCYDSDYFYSGSSPVLDNYGSTIRKVYELDITVEDMDGNPLADANVNIKQKDSYEEYHCWTDANGKLISKFDLQAVYLANRVKRTSSETEEYWSDDSNSSYHTITVSKAGYKSADAFNLVMDQDRTQTVQLRPLTKMYLGSTELTAIGIG